MSRKHSAGKGDSYRYVDMDKYSKNWDAIFSKKKGKKHEQHSTGGVGNRRATNRKGTTGG